MNYKEYREDNWVKIYGAKSAQIEKVYKSDSAVTIKGETGKFLISVLEPIAFTKYIERQINDKKQIAIIKNYLELYPDASIHELQNAYYDVSKKELLIDPL